MTRASPHDDRRRPFGPAWLAPALAALLLAGMAVGNTLKPSPADAEPYHQRVRAAADAAPDRIGDWRATSVPPDPAAIRLLRPNVIMKRRFSAPGSPVTASLVIVQSKDARDLIGHHPPVCYPTQGWKHETTRPVTWHAGPLTFNGVEYTFSKKLPDRVVTHTVANFVILPDGTIFTDHNQVRQFASDYTRRHFGAAQVWVVIDPDDAGPQRRHEIVEELLTGHLPLLSALGSATFEDTPDADGPAAVATAPADTTERKD